MGFFSELGATNDEILEWGECLLDCPHEPIQIACLSEPLFPDYAIGEEELLTNFTASYEKGSDAISLDV